MKLISAHIEGFGKLSDVDFDFDDEITFFERENGWGKSTLAAFIKVMLYGFEGEGKRDDLTNERKRYSPWQKGTYGGELVFLNEGKKYRLSKVFGKKSAEDDCVLSDFDTNIPITDIDAACVGKTFFHVDGPSYARSVYVSQNDVLTVESTDDIFDRIGGGISDSAEQIPYERMMDQLKKTTDSMSPSRKTGTLYKQSDEISNIENHLREEENIERSLNELNEMQDEYISNRDELAGRLSVLQKEQQEKSGYAMKSEQKKRYEELQSIYNDKETAYNEKLAKLGGRIPQRDDINGIISKTNELVELSGSLEGMKTNQQDKELEEVKKAFPDGVSVTKDEVSDRIRAWNKRNELKSAITSKKTTLQMAKLAYEKNSSKGVNPLLIIAVVIVAFAAVSLFFSPIVGAVLGVLGIVLLVISLLNKGNNSGSREMPNEYDALESEIRDDEQTIHSIEDDMMRFLSGLGMVYREEDVIGNLYKAESIIDNYDGIKERQRKYNDAKNRYDELSKDILEYLASFGFTASPDQIKDAVREINTLSSGLWQSETDLNDARSRLKKLEEEIVDIESLKNMEVPDNDVSLESISEEITSITDLLKELSDKISKNSRQIDTYRDKYVELQEERQRLEGLKEKQAEDEKKYEYLLKTRELLEKAKQNMALRYTGPVQKSLDEYLSMIMDAKDKEDVVIDANMHITAKELGQQREIEHLSHGYQGLVGICLRMAFADAMYEDEKPTLIFDDPFVNFDDDKLNKAKALVRSLGKRYQIIYFTCHKSRV